MYSIWRLVDGCRSPFRKKKIFTNVFISREPETFQKLKTHTYANSSVVFHMLFLYRYLCIPRQPTTFQKYNSKRTRERVVFTHSFDINKKVYNKIQRFRYDTQYFFPIDEISRPTLIIPHKIRNENKPSTHPQHLQTVKSIAKKKKKKFSASINHVKTAES